MTRPSVTVVVVPRERFSATRATLAALYNATPPPFEVVVVDGGAPRDLRRHLETEAAARGYRLVGDGALLLPNAARNVGLTHVTTPWVVFLDNDVVVAPGWLDALLDAAVETGAAVVCVTLGEQGSLARVGGREIRTPAYPVSVVDSTGAGDVFRAGFLAAWLHGGDATEVEDALRWANATAALKCRGLGARTTTPTLAELRAFLDGRL